MFSNFLTTIKTSGPLTIDIIVLVLIFIIFLFYGIYFGRNRLISLVLAFYPAMFLYNLFPYLAKLIILHGDTLILLNKVIIFLIFLILFDIIISRFIFADSGGGSGHYLRLAGCSLALVILIVSFSYSIISLDSVYNFSPKIDALFTASGTSVFWWDLAPLGLLFFL